MSAPEHKPSPAADIGWLFVLMVAVAFLGLASYQLGVNNGRAQAFREMAVTLRMTR